MMNRNKNDSSTRQQSRSNLKQTSASNARQAMNQRRHDLSSKIRKSKRTHHIQLKRRYNTDNFNTSAPTIGNDVIESVPLSMEQIIYSFITSPNKNTVTQLQQSLSCKQSDDNDLITKLLLVDHPEKGNEFMKILHSILTTSTETNMKIQALRILTNLAATNTLQEKEVDEEEDCSYYGPSQNSNNVKSWCESIICNLLTSALIPCLHLRNRESQQLQEIQSSDDDNTQQLKIISQTCWVIGNLAGEDSTLAINNMIHLSASSITTTREYMIRQTNVIQELIYLLKRSIQSYSDDISTIRMRNIIMEILRNSLWALSNLARGIYTSGLMFLVSNDNATTLLSSSDIVSILHNDITSSITSTSEEVEEKAVSWLEVSIEMYWLLAFLTAREDEVIKLLFLQDNNQNLLDLIIFHFHYATESILSSFKSSNRNGVDNDVVIRMIIPILRIIGNTACASGQYIPNILLRAHPQNVNENVVTILSKWMYIIDYHPSHDIMSISTEATWVCGTLLCDAGFDQHPSTTVACPILIPALCHVLIGSQFANTTLEWKREILSALWNAISIPPNSDSYNSFNIGDDTIKVRDMILKTICSKVEILKSIVAMIQCVDSDAIYLSLCIINVIHRRMLNRFDEEGNIKRALNDADCLNTLEGVCDSASANVQYGGGSEWNRDCVDNCADIAANLIDDFYDEEFHDEDSNHGVAVDTSNGFAFSVTTDPQQRFDFTTQSQTHRGSSANVEGIGRGRKNAVPAWMKQKK